MGVSGTDSGMSVRSSASFMDGNHILKVYGGHNFVKRNRFIPFRTYL